MRYDTQVTIVGNDFMMSVSLLRVADAECANVFDGAKCCLFVFVRIIK